MTAQEIAARLPLSTSLQEQVFSLPLTASQEQEWRQLFLQSQSAFEQHLHRQPAPELLALALYLRWAAITYQQYCDLGIPEAVFWDTFQDFILWSDECMRVTGKPGLTEWGWNSLLLRMEVFRIGRLEYQPRVLAHDITSGNTHLPAGTPVLEVHIPAGTSLVSHELCASFDSAVPFFHQYFQRSFAWFHCHSWLLSPALQHLLAPSSGILQFQQFFDVYDEDFSFPQAEQRVFGCILSDPAQYDVHTSLQRALKRYLMCGNRVGMGLGLMHYKSAESPALI